MATLRDIRQKIVGVKKTQQITKAMNMVAASKLRGSQLRMERFKPYAAKFGEVLSGLAGRVDQEKFALLQTRPEVKKIEVLLCTADRGLCGSFNTNLMVTCERYLRQLKAEGKEYSLVCVGRKGRDYFRRRNYPIRNAYTDILGKFGFDLAVRVGQELSNVFVSGEADEVNCFFTEFISAARMKPKMRKLLPISGDIGGGEAKTEAEYIFEPSAEVILEAMLPRNINVQIYDALLQNNVAENAARMAAMDNATRACKDMITSLTQTFNKARQAAITKELMDIVGGAEALKG